MGFFSLFKKKVNSTVEEKSTGEPERNVKYHNEHINIYTNRNVMTKGVPAEYSFCGDEKYKCQNMRLLTPLSIDVKAALENGVAGRQSYEGTKCFIIAETDEYVFYKYGCHYDGSGGCNLRQSKANPEDVVFFGKSRQHGCVFHDHLVQVNGSAYGTELYLMTKNIHNAKERIYPWFGKYAIPTGRGSRYNQDYVLGMRVDNDADVLIINVERRFCDYADPSDEEYMCNANTTYTLIVKYSDGKFHATAEYPELNVSQIFKNV